MKKTTLGQMAIILSTSALATANERGEREQRAIDLLHSIKVTSIDMAELKRANGAVEYLRQEAMRETTRSNVKIDISNWYKVDPPPRAFRYRALNQLQPFDGFDFIITKVECQVDYLNRFGAPHGSDKGPKKTKARLNQEAVWEASRNDCVNAFACSVDVTVENHPIPSEGTITFGPYYIPGEPTDCFEHAIDRYNF